MDTMKVQTQRHIGSTFQVRKMTGTSRGAVSAAAVLSFTLFSCLPFPGDWGAISFQAPNQIDASKPETTRTAGIGTSDGGSATDTDVAALLATKQPVLHDDASTRQESPKSPGRASIRETDEGSSGLKR